MDQTKIDALRALPIPPQGHLIDGARVPASDGAVMEVVSPIDGKALTTMARGTAADVDAAVLCLLWLGWRLQALWQWSQRQWRLDPLSNEFQQELRRRGLVGVLP